MTDGVLSLADAIKRVEMLGGTVTQVHCSGELLFDHWLALRRQRVAANRKDAGRALMQWIRKLERARNTLLRELMDTPARAN